MGITELYPDLFVFSIPRVLGLRGTDLYNASPTRESSIRPASGPVPSSGSQDSNSWQGPQLLIRSKRLAHDFQA